MSRVAPRPRPPFPSPVTDRTADPSSDRAHEELAHALMHAFPGRDANWARDQAGHLLELVCLGEDGEEACVDIRTMASMCPDDKTVEALFGPAVCNILVDFAHDEGARGVEFILPRFERGREGNGPVAARIINAIGSAGAHRVSVNIRIDAPMHPGGISSTNLRAVAGPAPRLTYRVYAEDEPGHIVINTPVEIQPDPEERLRQSGVRTFIQVTPPRMLENSATHGFTSELAVAMREANFADHAFANAFPDRFEIPPAWAERHCRFKEHDTERRDHELALVEMFSKRLPAAALLQMLATAAYGGKPLLHPGLDPTSRQLQACLTALGDTALPLADKLALLGQPPLRLQPSPERYAGLKADAGRLRGVLFAWCEPWEKFAMLKAVCGFAQHERINREAFVAQLLLEDGNQFRRDWIGQGLGDDPGVAP